MSTGNEAPEPMPTNGKPPRASQFEIGDEREPWRYWIPVYIAGEYAAQIGHPGVAVYSSLAWWHSSDAPHHRPSLKEIAAHAGCSRATVWRVLQKLAAANLIRIEHQVGQTGRRAHRIVLTHPPKWKGKCVADGPEVAGALPLSARRAHAERAARSEGARGALTLSAPSLDELGSNVCVELPPTHTPEAAPQNQDAPDACEKICARWIAQLPPGTPSWTEGQAESIHFWAGCLLRKGWTEEQLLRSINKPDRNPAEWPRQWAGREHPGLPRAAQRPARAVEVPQEANAQSLTAEEADRLREEGGGSAVEAVRKRRKRGSVQEDSQTGPAGLAP